MLLLTTLALLTPPPAPDGVAQHHPAGVVLYLEVADVQAALKAYGRTALITTLSDRGLLESVGGSIGLAGFDPIAMGQAAYDEWVGSGELPPMKELLIDPLRSASLSLSVPGGTLKPVVLEDLVRNLNPGWILENFGVQLELELDDEQASTDLLEALMRLLSAQGGVELRTVNEGAAQVVRLVGDPAMEEGIALIRSGRYLTLLLGPEAPAAYLERLSGQAPGFDATDHPAFTGRGTTVLRYHATLTQEFLALEELQLFGPLIELAGGILGPMVPMLVRGGDWRIGIEESGRVIAEGLTPRPTGRLDQVLGSRAMDPGATALIHPDAIVGWAAHLNTAPLIELFQDVLGGADGGELAQMEERYGFRPDWDLVAPLGSTLAYSMPEPQTLLGAPPFMVSAGLSDSVAFKRGLDGLAEYLRVETEGRIRLATSEYRGVRLDSLEINWREAQLPVRLPVDLSTVLKPTIAVCGEHVFVTTLPNHAKREIRRLQKREASGARPKREFPEGCSSVGFANWPRFLGRLYDAWLAMIPLIETVATDSGVAQLGGLPSADRLLSRFQESERWRRPHGPDWVQHFQESSAGLELPMLVLGGLALTGVSVAPPAPLEPPEVEDVASSSEDRGAAEVQAQFLKAALERYLAENPVEPTSWDSLVGKYLDEAARREPDPWGGAFHFEFSVGGLRVWCDGPNGLNERGLGDDIVVR